MKKANKIPKIEQVFDVEYKFTTQEINEISRRCFYDNKDYKKIKKTFKALAKM